MSYILDALRKSEQQRQAIQPDSVTERILVNNAHQPAQKSVKWLKFLVITNLLAISSMGWFFFQKPQLQIQQQKILTPSARDSLDTKTQQAIIQKNSAELEKNRNQVNPSLRKPNVEISAEPSIAHLLEEKKQSLKTGETQQAMQQITNKKPITVKKESKSSKQNEQKFENKIADRSNDQQAALPPGNIIPDLKELSSDTRNPLPKLNINVFSYAEKLDDRFVIIDMVKYKAGQLIKDNVRLKEIRSDSIVLEDQYGTFTVERP
jgi:general secretion pathway protein B